MPLGISVGSAFITIIPDLTQFNRRVASGVTRSLGGLTGKFQSAGRQLTRYVTLPILAAGAESVKMAATFNTTFTRTSVLAGKLGVSMDEAKRRVLALAHATGQDPGGLAEALYFTASAGLKTSLIFPVLGASARAAEAQMGDVQTIAQLLTSTLNAYQGQGLNAAKAMDELTAAIRVGKAEPAELARTLGTVITVAAQMKVSFAEVTAAVATATDVGVPAARAVTGLRYVLQNIQAPTLKSQKALASYNISVKELQDRVAKQGLIHTLQFLAKTFNLNTVAGKAAWNSVIGGARGLVVANTLIGNTAKLANRNLASVKNSVGDFNGAVKAMDESQIVQFQKALADLKIAAIQAGDELIPLATKVVRIIAGWAAGFSHLSPAMKTFAINTALVLAAAGPLLRLFIAFKLVFGPLISKLLATAGAEGALGEAAGAAGVGATEAAAGMQALAAAATEAALALRAFSASAVGAVAGEGQLALFATEATGALEAEAVAGAEATASIEGAGTATLAFGSVAGAVLVGVAAGLVTGIVLWKGYNDAINRAKDTLGRFGPTSGPGRPAQRTLTGLHAGGAGKYAGLEAGSKSFQKQIAPMLAKEDLAAQYAMFRAINHTTEGFKAYVKVIGAANEITAKQADTISRTVSALAMQGKDLTQLQQQQVRNLLAVGDFTGAMKILNAQMKIAPAKIADTVNELQRMNVKVTAHTQHALSAAIADGDWAKAWKILQRVMSNNNVVLGGVQKKVLDLNDAIAVSGTKIDKATRASLHAAIADRNWNLALKIEREIIKGSNKHIHAREKALSQSAAASEAARIKGKSLNKVYKTQDTTLDRLRAILKASGRALTKHESEQVANAVAAHRWAKAIKIVRDRLKDEHVNVKKVAQSMKQSAQAHVEAINKAKGLNKAYGTGVKIADHLKGSTNKVKDAIKNIPKKKTIQWEVPGLKPAITDTDTLTTKLNDITSRTWIVHLELQIGKTTGWPTHPPWGTTATGGVTTGPQVRLIGEAGPEAIIPLSQYFNQDKPTTKSRFDRTPVKLIVDGREFSAFIEEATNGLTAGRPYKRTVQ